MIRTDFNGGWTYKRAGESETFPVTLPYDCMLREGRSDSSPGGCNNGWFIGRDYEFVKMFEYTAVAGNETVLLEFEGIYHQGKVFLNGEQVAYRPNGYIGITADLSGKLKEGENEIRVTAKGADVPNSRWYTGVGIYRPVWLYTAGKSYLPPYGIKIRTVSLDPAVIEVKLGCVGRGRAKVEIADESGVAAETALDVDGAGSVRLTVPNARLWSAQQPNLYTCKVDFCGDKSEHTFGIRMIECTPQKGLEINGVHTLLRGCCLHHDNGLLGAVSLPEAEERKVKILKDCGFNAIRSAHNPCSIALLNACDKLGMYVMDEYADSWYVRKTKYDYAGFLEEWYERDLKDMTERDYNHPSVILYSLGNEVTETAEARGVELYGKMQACVKSHDATRPVTCGINIGFNQAAYKGHSFFSDEKAERNAENFHDLGTERSNHLKWMFGPLFTKLNAVLPGCDKATREAFGAMDVAGYNYGILRYKRDRKKYPNRIILGSETFCEDVERFVRISEKDKGIIGDFVWTGMDHLGEVGLGAFEYRDYAPTYIHTLGWLTSGCGRVDVTGKPLAEAYYMKAAYGMLEKPVVAVKPVNHNGERHSPSGWKFTEAVESWAWTGCEGKVARVEAYGCGDKIELWLNGRRVGKKSLKKSCRAKFKIRYRSGELTAKVISGGKVVSESTLKSAMGETRLVLEPECENIERGKLAYIRIRIADGEGTTAVLKRERVKVSVEGGDLVGLGHACPYNDDGYLGDETGTYFGEALAVVRPSGDCVKVTACSKIGNAEVVLKSK